MRLGLEPSATDRHSPVGAPAQVLVVGRERRLLALARAALGAGHYLLRYSETAAVATDELCSAPADALLILQEGAADDVLTCCRELQATADAAIVILAADADVAQRVAGLGCADDYVTLPVAPTELAARLAAVLRRTLAHRGPGRATFDDGSLRVDLGTRVVTLGAGPVDLTPTEYRLLAVLVGAQGRVFTHEQLLGRVWGAAYAGDSHLLRLHIANLRHKIDVPGTTGYIQTHRGVGYAFRAPETRGRGDPQA